MKAAVREGKIDEVKRIVTPKKQVPLNSRYLPKPRKDTRPCRTCGRAEVRVVHEKATWNPADEYNDPIDKHFNPILLQCREIIDSFDQSKPHPYFK